MIFLSRARLVWICLIPAAVSSLRLKSYPDVATQGEVFTLSCVLDLELLVATWILNSDPVFNTQSNAIIPAVQGRDQSYFITSGRITVSTYSKQHNVTLRINSTLDDGSVWVCGQGGIYSNNLTIHVIQHATVVSTSQTTKLQNVQTSTSEHGSMDTTMDVQSNKISSSTTELLKGQTDKQFIYIVIGSVVGSVVVFVIIVTVVCVIRKKRNQTARTKCPTPKEHGPVHEGEDDVDNSDMIENVLYCGYSDPQNNTDENRSIGENKAQTSDETRVTDVYAQVQKKKNRTEVQVTVNIDDLYAKPVRKKSKDTANISVNNNVNINIGNIADESV